MPLEVIGPGFGRTGTASLKRALEILGFGPCHHMKEIFAHPEQVPAWQDIGAHRPVEWDSVFAGYRSQVDWPGAHCWRELIAAYPKAKIVLSVRSDESWWKSFSATIGTLLNEPENVSLPPHIRAMQQVTRHMIEDETFNAKSTDREAGLAALHQRTADVRAAIPADRLLVYEVSEGWGPLCQFLEIPVPLQSFPHANSTAEFWELIRGGSKPH